MSIILFEKNFEIEGTNKQELKGIIKEVFTEDSYYFDTNESKPMILDIGAHVGVATHYFKHYFPQATIIAVEPLAQAFELLEHNVSHNRLESVTCINAALATSTTPQIIYVDDANTWLSTASFTEGAWDQSQSTHPQQVLAITLSELISMAKEKYGAEKIDLLKMDIEGAEVAVLQQSKAALQKVDQCIVEFHPSKGNNLPEFLIFMKKQGFGLEFEVKTSGKKRNQLQLLHFKKG